MTAPPSPVAALHSCLVFCLNNETYAIDLHKVREIIADSPITPIENSPPLIQGTIEFRGDIITVFDLPKRLNKAVNSTNFIVILDKVGTQNNSPIGLPVDKICNVARIENSEIQPTDKPFCLGSASVDGETITLLDLETLLKIS